MIQISRKNKIEEAVAHQNNNQKQNRKIAHIFAKCGMDPLDMEIPAFAAHLETLSQDSIYNSLIQNQQATDVSLL